MKTQASETNTNSDFEEWARLLICRKVPDNYRDLVDPEVIHSGADILKRGDAFEVHICDCEGCSTTSTDESDKKVFVTPFPERAHQMRLRSVTQ